MNILDFKNKLILFIYNIVDIVLQKNTNKLIDFKEQKLLSIKNKLNYIF